MSRRRSLLTERRSEAHPTTIDINITRFGPTDEMSTLNSDFINEIFETIAVEFRDDEYSTIFVEDFESDTLFRNYPIFFRNVIIGKEKITF